MPMDGALLGMHDPLPEGNDRRDKRHEGDERGRWEMSATVLPKASVEETRSMLAGETHLATRAADFEELLRELVEESGRALEEGYHYSPRIREEFFSETALPGFASPENPRAPGRIA